MKSENLRLDRRPEVCPRWQCPRSIRKTLMKNLSTLAATLVFSSVAAYGQTIVADDYNVTGSGTGFALDNGVNSGINPPTTRLTGTAASGMRYIQTATGKAASNFTITGNKQQVAFSAN